MTAPDSWQPVIALCDAVTADLPRLVPEIVEIIRREVPGYHVVDRDEHIVGVTEQFEGLLIGLSTRRPPSARERERARELGRLRAREGVSMQSLMGAYHVGYREMWNVLLTRADERGSGLAAHLVRLVGTVWTWVQQATTAAADAYGEAVRAEDAAQLGLTYRFLDALLAGGASPADLTRLAHAITLDPGGDFQAVCSPAACWSDERLAELRLALRRPRGVLRCVNRGTTMLALLQRIPAEALLTEMHRREPHAPIGVGLPRPGLPGAAATIVDAQQVLPLARGGAVVHFRDEWLPATLLPQADRLAAVLASVRAPAAEHPDLADTVRHFADHGMSLAATGRALHVHPNTVKYRLDRWQELTGWDARTWDGLSRSMLGLGLFAPAPTEVIER